MTPEQLETILTVCAALAPKHTFGIYDEKDIEQEGFLICAEALERYDPDKGATLKTFLYTHLNNRLLNFKRKHHYTLNVTGSHEEIERKTKLNQQKKALIEPLHISKVKHDYESNMQYYDDPTITLDIQAALKHIDEALPIDMREDYLKMKDDIYISKTRREEIETKIKEVLEKDGFETW